MKSVWTEGEVRLHRPIKSRMKILWTLWITAFLLLGLWLAGMAFMPEAGAWLHLPLAGAVVLAIPCILYGLRYTEYLEPLMFRWRSGSNLRHTRPTPSPPQGSRPHHSEEHR